MPPRRVYTRNSVETRFSPLSGAKNETTQNVPHSRQQVANKEPWNGILQNKPSVPKTNGVKLPSQKYTIPFSEVQNCTRKSTELRTRIVASPLSRNSWGTRVYFVYGRSSSCLQTTVKMKEEEEKGRQGFHQVPLQKARQQMLHCLCMTLLLNTLSTQFPLA